MLRKLLISSVLLLTSCEYPVPEPNTVVMETKVNDRFSIERVGVFGDGLAYGDRRGIYLIKDKISGKEFVGISGIGITEVGSHPVGETTAEDER